MICLSEKLGEIAKCFGCPLHDRTRTSIINHRTQWVCSFSLSTFHPNHNSQSQPQSQFSTTTTITINHNHYRSWWGTNLPMNKNKDLACLSKSNPEQLKTMETIDAQTNSPFVPGQTKPFENSNKLSSNTTCGGLTNWSGNKEFEPLSWKMRIWLWRQLGLTRIVWFTCILSQEWRVNSAVWIDWADSILKLHFHSNLPTENNSKLGGIQEVDSITITNWHGTFYSFFLGKHLVRQK